MASISWYSHLSAKRHAEVKWRDTACLLLLLVANMRIKSSVWEQIVVARGHQVVSGDTEAHDRSVVPLFSGSNSCFLGEAEWNFISSLWENRGLQFSASSLSSKLLQFASNSWDHIWTLAHCPFHTLKCYLLAVHYIIFHDPEVSLFYIHRILNTESHLFIPEIALYFSQQINHLMNNWVCFHEVRSSHLNLLEIGRLWNHGFM